VRLFSDLWSIVEGRHGDWQSRLSDAALAEIPARELLKQEVERRVRKLRDTLGAQGLHLQRRCAYLTWERKDVVDAYGLLHPGSPILVGDALAYVGPQR